MDWQFKIQLIWSPAHKELAHCHWPPFQIFLQGDRGRHSRRLTGSPDGPHPTLAWLAGIPRICGGRAGYSQTVEWTPFMSPRPWELHGGTRQIPPRKASPCAAAWAWLGCREHPGLRTGRLDGVPARDSNLHPHHPSHARLLLTFLPPFFFASLTGYSFSLSTASFRFFSSCRMSSSTWASTKHTTFEWLFVPCVFFVKFKNGFNSGSAMGGKLWGSPMAAADDLSWCSVSAVLPALWSPTPVPSVSPVWSVPGHSPGGNSTTRLYSSTGLWSGRIKKRKMNFFFNMKMNKNSYCNIKRRSNFLFYCVEYKFE